MVERAGAAGSRYPVAKIRVAHSGLEDAAGVSVADGTGVKETWRRPRSVPREGGWEAETGRRKVLEGA